MYKHIYIYNAPTIYIYNHDFVIILANINAIRRNWATYELICLRTSLKIMISSYFWQKSMQYDAIGPRMNLYF